MKISDMKLWYQIDHVEDVPSPQLVVYPDRVEHNIREAIAMVGDVSRLRPHIKTNKTAEVVRMMIHAGITKFKFATAEEGALLAEEKAADVLMAYQPVGPRVGQLADLIINFPATTFSCVLDHPTAAERLNNEFARLNLTIDVYIDLNVGMNRTGVGLEKAFDLYTFCASLPALHVRGIHAYDGHLRDPDINKRRAMCNELFKKVEDLADRIVSSGLAKPLIIAGGSPSFPIHAERKDVECSPGTFVLWDQGYGSICSEQPFLAAALVVTRVLSLPAPGRICIDMGHKAIASENDISKRVVFLNAPGLNLISQSEEHGVVDVAEGHPYLPGDVLYALPYHICPTVNMYQQMMVITEHRAKDSWYIKARH
jgi:D-serine deaminase-like pyridoxal phosphate-dependent protein